MDKGGGGKSGTGTGKLGGKRGTEAGTQGVKAGRGRGRQVHALHEQKIASADTV